MGKTDDLKTLLCDLTFEKVDEKTLSGSQDGFCRALSVWLNKPHVVNRRLSGAQILCTLVTDLRLGSVSLIQVIGDILLKYEDDRTCGAVDKHLDSERLAVDVDNLDAVDPSSTVIVLRDLHPKQLDRYLILRELVIFDKLEQTALFCPISKRSCKTDASHRGELTQVSHTEINSCLQRELKYRVSFKPGSDESDSSVLMEYSYNSELETSAKPQSHVTTEWLRDVLLVKLCRWAELENLRTEVTSLKLVPVDKYALKYQHLKQKYGTELVKIWPESTDPQKFVYEDIAIATYLLLLWEEERQKTGLTHRQRFVDLGCGNGLLAYILTMEGHRGLGIDVRRRKIWDMFGSTVNLQESSITPSACSLFPEYDWLIGNHSDELTPWIPVMAARSSYTCSYFVLPCCLHDFDRRFSLKESGRSQYRTYLDFVMEVGKVCGFEVLEDTLRIPSTKRVCFVGNKRTYNPTEESDIDEQRSHYIAQRCLKTPIRNKISSSSITPMSSGQRSRESDSETFPETKRGRLDLPAGCQESPSHGAGSDQANTETEQWASEFQPRNSKECSRNCRDVDRGTKEGIVMKVFERVLAADRDEVKVTADGRTWHIGGSLPLPEAAAMFDRDVLQQLKCECGGIQTLLRNYHYIFEVFGGCVRLRDTSIPRPPKRSKKKSSKGNPKDLNKTFLCWFHDHHPDGCPSTDLACSYAHGPAQLRERPNIDPS
ncbi:probable tRNA (uracil-O(2)-)-methyltransferase [Liolophura sinensis]|uniref:probable tRNA (uracil-O(2)-)-methyltransferase n=1 Tax=Liolophura sinensis TaxID=3198878 RepID=UPI0031589982